MWLWECFALGSNKYQNLSCCLWEQQQFLFCHGCYRRYCHSSANLFNDADILSPCSRTCLTVTDSVSQFVFDQLFLQSTSEWWRPFWTHVPIHCWKVSFNSLICSLSFPYWLFYKIGVLFCFFKYLQKEKTTILLFYRKKKLIRKVKKSWETLVLEKKKK